MTSRLVTLLVGCSAIVFLTGCEVETLRQPPLSYPPANHMVINELYTLPVTHRNAHSWLELYNPTQQTINVQDWSLSYKTIRYRQVTLIYYDTIRRPEARLFIRSITVSVTADTPATTYDVPLFRTAPSIPGVLYRFPIFAPDTIVPFTFSDTITTPLRIRPNQFLTLVSNLERLRVYNTIGPGEGPNPTSTPFLPAMNPLVRIAVLERDTLRIRASRPDSIYSYIYDFYLQQTDQVVLKDSAGQTVDVVRYGNYAFTGPGPDPYPTYRSIGTIPMYESMARYAGAYDTKNTANDFYITREGLPPIPHWLSQLYKK